MDVPQLILQKLNEMGLEQRSLADAAEVTESYISQLLSRKKSPPAPDRTDIYDKLEAALKLPGGKLADLARQQRNQELKKKIEDTAPAPLLKEVRELILGKCKKVRRNQVRAIFEKEAFGELERLVTQKLVDVVKSLAREELGREDWLREVARLSNRSYRQMRVSALEFLDSDVFSISAASCVAFLDPLIVSWDIDLTSFALEIVLNRRIASTHLKKFEYVERPVETPVEDEPGFQEFLRDPSLSAGATVEEVAFLRRLSFTGSRRPTGLYYYRELQNLRDPLNFRQK